MRTAFHSALRNAASMSPPLMGQMRLASSSTRHISQRHLAQRTEAWKHFCDATRHLTRAVRSLPSVKEDDRHPDMAGAVSLVTSNTRHAAMGRTVHISDEESAQEDIDPALVALAPHIARQTATAASNAVLMQELGVVDRAEYRPLLIRDASLSEGLREDLVDRSPPLALWAPYLHRVCQTGIQAQVSSLVLLRHLWSAFQPPAAHTAKPSERVVGELTGAVGPCLGWCAQLPAAVRLLLLTHEQERLTRRRRFIDGGLHGEGVETADTAKHSTTLDGLERLWQKTLRESRAVLRCCAASWLQEQRKEEEKGLTVTAISVLHDPMERQVLLAALRLAAVCQAEDAGVRMMKQFLSAVDACLDGGTMKAAPASQLPSLLTSSIGDVGGGDRSREELLAWLESEGVAMYDAALDCVAQQRTHARSPFSRASATAHYAPGDEFPLAYAFFIQRCTALAKVQQLRTVAEGHTLMGDGEGSDLAVGGGWTTAITQYPLDTMHLIAPLAACVSGNVEQLHVVLQLYLRLLEETEVGYTAQAQATVRAAFCAVMRALSRVPLQPQDRVRLLEDTHRRTLLNSPLEVLQHADVLASTLAVCAAAGASTRALTLFNKLAEPSTRSRAMQEPNMAAVVLLPQKPTAVLQRVLSFMQMKLPLTASIVHAAAASCLLRLWRGEEGKVSSTLLLTPVFALLDLLRGTAVNSTTRHTATLCADRTLFLRLLALLMGLHRRPSEAEEQGRVLPAPLLSETAADIVVQWMREVSPTAASSSGDQSLAPEAAQLLTAVAAALSPVTIGVVQKICIELRCAHRGGSAVGFDCPLLTVLESVLAAVPSDISSVAWITRETAAAGSATVALPLHILPPAMQTMQLLESWPATEVSAFMQALSQSVTASTTASLTSAHEAAPICVSYRDWQVLKRLHARASEETTWLAEEELWSPTTASRHSDVEAETAASASMSKKRHQAADGVTDALWRKWESTHVEVEGTDVRTSGCPAIKVLSPLAEVDWYVQCRGGSTMLTVPLAEALHIVVPPVLGQSVHSWLPSHNTNSSAHAAHDAVAYWLQQWIDVAEDGRLFPAYSVFQRQVVRVLASAGPQEAGGQEETVDASPDAEGSEMGEGEKMKVAGSATSNAMKAHNEVVSVLVQGPASLFMSEV